jgi:transposase InsO family protein
MAASCGSALRLIRPRNPLRGWQHAPKYLMRDRDRAYGEVFTRGVRSMGIHDQPTAPRSPWQNGHAERLIGSIRHECLDHVVMFGESHLRHLLRSYMHYYNSARTHLSLTKMRQSHEPIRSSDAFCRHQFLADCTINMFGFNFRSGQ